MSKSTRTPHLHPHAGKPGNRATASTAAPDTRTRPPRIDYGPVIAAVHDVAAWAFGLAAREVADSPDGQRRVRTTRRFVLAQLRGKRPRGVPLEDLLFTAGLLARIFETDLRLPMSDMMAMFGRLGFATWGVPPRPRTPSAACRPQDPPITPAPAAGGGRPASAGSGDECSHFDPRFRNAA